MLPSKNAKGTVKPESDEETVAEAIRKGYSTRAEVQRKTGFSQPKTINLPRGTTDTGILRKEGESGSTRYILMQTLFA